ncbi:hypothetical protein AB0H71_28845 [Nocardia sp. NPDC050697]|uniref:hypothetical protein n=1 Tax=Nocardia sp. NPDC050697 TaxID=3155158 RepID=UPI0033DDED37
MNPVNRAEEDIVSALVRELHQLKRDFNEFRAHPQSIGNGSMNWAIFPVFTLGPYAIPAGTTQYFSALYMDDSLPFTYDGKDAINRRTDLDFLMSVFVDALDAAHTHPLGASLTSGQRSMDREWWFDSAGSELSEESGQRLVIMKIKNTDSVSHNYYIQGQALIPRPALKPL